ncbi:hypothetical protein, partial [Vibrio sp. 10N.222.52.C12]|uniref:hypothetical protein n=1 Tax=Vibrio sp. 10N.222.52.C12 TaxID=3229630 RepID=UPI00354F9ABF
SEVVYPKVKEAIAIITTYKLGISLSVISLKHIIKLKKIRVINADIYNIIYSHKNLQVTLYQMKLLAT